MTSGLEPEGRFISFGLGKKSKSKSATRFFGTVGDLISIHLRALRSYSASSKELAKARN
jgi:hypothetical protein